MQQVLISAYGVPLAHATRQASAGTSADSGPLRSLSRTVTSPFDNTEVVGAIKLVPNWPEIQRQAKLAVQSNVGMMILLAAGIILVIAFTTTFFVIRPVKQISDNLHRLKAEEGETLRLPESHEENELGRLVNDVNDLVTRFRHSLDREHDLHLKQVVHEKTRLSAAVFEYSQEGMGIIRAIIQLGKTSKLTVIAEGVETDRQLNTLQALECNEAQGYLISKPLRPEDFRAFYQEWAKRDGKA